MRRHALLIVGMHRGGTSALAAALVAAGASAGGRPRAQPDRRDDEGFASAPIVAFNDELLTAFGSRWDGLAPLPDGWQERVATRSRVEHAHALVARELDQGECVVVKDARISRLLPFWRPVLEGCGFDVSVALVLRRPIEVAASLARYRRVAVEKSLALWLSHLVAAERDSRGAPRALITFDRLLDAPAGALSQVIAATRLPLRLDDAAREAALTAIRPELRRHGPQGAVAPTASLGSGLDRVLDEGYARLARLPAGADPRREVEALAASASAPMTAAIPPWLVHELDADREAGERQAEAVAASRHAVATLEGRLLQGERTESELRARLAALSRTEDQQARDTRIDASLATLRDDFARVAATLAEQPAREETLRVELARAQRDLADERATIGTLAEEVEQLRHATDEQQQQLAAANEHMQALVDEIEQARGAHAARDEHEASLQMEIDAAHAENHTLMAERDALRRDRDQAQRKADALLPELESLRRDLAVIAKERESAAREAAQVGEALMTLRDELARRAAHESALVDERARLLAEMRQSAERIGGLERELAGRSTDLKSLAGRYEALTRTLGAVERRWIGRIALNRVRRN